MCAEFEISRTALWRHLLNQGKLVEPRLGGIPTISGQFRIAASFYSPSLILVQSSYQPIQMAASQSTDDSICLCSYLFDISSPRYLRERTARTTHPERISNINLKAVLISNTLRGSHLGRPSISSRILRLTNTFEAVDIAA